MLSLAILNIVHSSANNAHAHSPCQLQLHREAMAELLQPIRATKPTLLGQSLGTTLYENIANVYIPDGVAVEATTSISLAGYQADLGSVCNGEDGAGRGGANRDDSDGVELD
jgi:hypothetical protein